MKNKNTLHIIQNTTCCVHGGGEGSFRSVISVLSLTSVCINLIKNLSKKLE